MTQIIVTVIGLMLFLFYTVVCFAAGYLTCRFARGRLVGQAQRLLDDHQAKAEEASLKNILAGAVAPIMPPPPPPPAPTTTTPTEPTP